MAWKLDFKRLYADRVPVINLNNKHFTRYKNYFVVGNNSSDCLVPTVSRCEFDYDQEMADLTTVKLTQLILYGSKRCCDFIHNWKLGKYQIRSSTNKWKILVAEIMHWVT